MGKINLLLGASILRSLLASMVLVIFAPAALSSVVTYKFTGTVEYVEGIFAGQGTVVKGTFSFDDGLIDSNPSSEADVFTNRMPASNQSLTSSFSATLTVGAVTVTNTTAAAIAELKLIDSDIPTTGDGFEFGLYRFGASGLDDFFIQGEDYLPFPTDAIAPGSLNLTGAIGDAISILDTLDLSLFGPGRDKLRSVENIRS